MQPIPPNYITHDIKHHIQQHQRISTCKAIRPQEHKQQSLQSLAKKPITEGTAADSLVPVHRVRPVGSGEAAPSKKPAFPGNSKENAAKVLRVQPPKRLATAPPLHSPAPKNRCVQASSGSGNNLMRIPAAQASSESKPEAMEEEKFIPILPTSVTMNAVAANHSDNTAYL